MKIAIVHDWLVTYGGAERVLREIIDLYPQADLFSLVNFLPQNRLDFIKNKIVKTSFIQKLPFARSKYRSYLPLMPLAIEQFDFSGYDLVISTSHAVAKGALTGPEQLHISYVNSPMRYAWDLMHQYLNDSGLNRGLRGFMAKAVLHYLRNWDVRSANGVDYFIANSSFIARRINKYYRRECVVIHPPVDVAHYNICLDKEDYYLTISRLVSYKKVEMVVEAFANMPGKKLIVIGDGPEYSRIKAKARGNIILLGYQPDSVVKQYMQKARAFVFAAIEDFGIVPVEAQACGTPVIAYGRGGVLDTVIDRENGLFFHEQTPQALCRAVREFERSAFDCQRIRSNALRFSTTQFRIKFSQFVQEAITEFYGTSDKTGQNVRSFSELVLKKAVEEQLEEPIANF